MAIASHKLGSRRELDPFVSYLRLTESLTSSPLAPYLRLPDGQLELVVRIAAQGGDIKVVGTRMSAFEKHTMSALGFLTVRFKPGGAYPFFGLPLSELTDQLVPLETLWGAAADELTQALSCARSQAAHVALVEQALLRRLATQPFEPSSAPSVRRAIRLLRAAAELPTVEALAHSVGTSTRQLRRAFAEVVGVGPKQYLRVERFQRALRAAKRFPDLSFSVIAGRAGYFDQAHLNAEFQALAGATPGALCPRIQAEARTVAAPRAWQ